MQVMPMEINNNALVWVIVGVVAVVLLALLLGGGTGNYGVMGYGMMGFPMVFGGLFMLLFWGAAIWFVVALLSSSHSNRKDDSDPLTILKGRYAKGEVTRKEFEEMKKGIQG